MWKKVIGEIRLRLEAGLGWVGLGRWVFLTILDFSFGVKKD